MTEGSLPSSPLSKPLLEAPGAEIPEGSYLTPRGEIITYDEGYKRFMKQYGHIRPICYLEKK